MSNIQEPNARDNRTVHNNQLHGINNVRGRIATPKEVAYRDGYVEGQSTEAATQRYHRASDRLQAEREARARESTGISAGLLGGLLLALLAALLGGAFYYLTRPVEPAVTEEPVERETTVIERTVENTEVIEVPDLNPPQVEVPDVNVQAPDINIEAPSAAPAQAPQTSEPAPAPSAASDPQQPAAEGQ